jgi:hypothetical protein
MKICRLFIVSTVMSIILASGIATAGVHHKLKPGTTFQEGCVPPCLCPVLISEEVIGTFTLVQERSIPLYARYRLDNISWTITDPNGEVLHTITGQGTYRLGGKKFRAVHQLILDIGIDGTDTQHLDSGLIPGGGEFPTISISVNRGTSCYDIWMDIKAAPSETGSTGANPD